MPYSSGAQHLHSYLLDMVVAFSEASVSWPQGVKSTVQFLHVYNHLVRLTPAYLAERGNNENVGYIYEIFIPPGFSV